MRVKREKTGWAIFVKIVILFLILFWEQGQCIYARDMEDTEILWEDLDETAWEGMQNRITQGEDYKKLEDYLLQQEETEQIDVGTWLSSMMNGETEWDIASLAELFVKQLFREISEQKAVIIMIIVMIIIFSFLQRFSTVFQNGYISEICFIMMYLELIVLFIKSYRIVNELLFTIMEKQVGFMKLLVPVYGLSLFFSNGQISAGAMYELTFVVIFLVQWVMMKILAPTIEIFVLLQFLNHMVGGDKISKICKLLEDFVRNSAKVMMSVVMGMNLVQGLITPAMDRFKTSAWAKAIGAIPGIGNSANAVGELLVGTGTLLKNSIGVIAMVILLLITLLPLAKMLGISICYKVTCALLEPIGDKRLIGGLQGVYQGTSLAIRMVMTSMFLFFITIAMITASSSLFG